MATIINASTTALTVTPDTSGQLTLQANGVTALTANTTGYLNFPYQPTIAGTQWPAFSAFRNANQSISSNTWTKVQFNNEDFDTNNNFDSTTNYRFTPTVAGYYQLNFYWANGSNSTYNYAAFYKNGSLYKLTINNGSGATSGGISSVIYFNGSTDYVEAYVYSDFGPIVGSSTAYNTFNGAMLRAA